MDFKLHLKLNLVFITINTIMVLLLYEHTVANKDHLGEGMLLRSRQLLWLSHFQIYNKLALLKLTHLLL